MSVVDLWDARTKSLAYLRTNQPQQLQALEEHFSLLDACIDVYEAHSASSSYAQVCGVTTLKAKNLALSSYSLILDCLGQEAGATLRPFIEYTELLTYFRIFPSSVNAAIENKLPSAGERAKAIDGIYKDFRKHLNLHASHSSYSHFSLGHLFEPGTKRFKKLQVMHPHVLERNVRDFAVQLFLLAHEAVLGLQHLSMDEVNRLGADCDALKERVIEVFGLDDA